MQYSHYQKRNGGGINMQNRSKINGFIGLLVLFNSRSLQATVRKCKRTRALAHMIII